MKRSAFPLTLGLVIAFCGAIPSRQGIAVDLIRLTPANYDRLVPAGKEVDAIYGDWVLRNDRITAVLAAPVEGRNANMTVRGVGGMLIDLTTHDMPSDQLSCFYPGGARYRFTDPSLCTIRRDEGSTLALEGDHLRADSLSVTFVGTSIAGDGTTAAVTYVLREKRDWIEYSVEIRNEGPQPVEVQIEDMLRCDGNLFRTGTLGDTGVFFAEDVYFGQAYAIAMEGKQLHKVGGRNMQLRPVDTPAAKIDAGATWQWSGAIACAQGIPALQQWAQRWASDEDPRQLVEIIVRDGTGPLEHARVEFHHQDRVLGTVHTLDAGRIAMRLVPGTYQVEIDAHGLQPTTMPLTVQAATTKVTLELPTASRVAARVVDGSGAAIPAKVQFLGRNSTATPDWGPDSAISAVKNVVYAAHGKFVQCIDPGEYEVIISHGPEYDAVWQRIQVNAGETTPLQATLRRVVDTSGWVSADFHSHSSPSGDNVSHQTGRVLNLLAENIEFAPCTEHNRIDTYEDDLALLNARQHLATCSGIELTGNPLPINHQNAFPLIMHAHHQDGGGPTTDPDPVAQIERLALWDNASDKIVQTNHPNIPQILGDKDLDGKPDEGFRGMLGWMDVIEVHPPEGIFAPPAPDTPPPDRRKNPIFYWLQLLNLGYRIPGVINTDAHYNFHGSGWYRNYLQSSSDDPREISVAEMIRSAELGRIVMTTGPFLEVHLNTQHDGQNRQFGIGDDVVLGDASAHLHVRVQCPNWLDINRVQVFANGRPLPELNFTRRTHPQMFSEANVRFDQAIDLPAFQEDTHLIVAVIGEGLKLGPVMGPERGELPPVAVSNPIFLNVDDQAGFQSNGDDLGVPFMLPGLHEH